jgi:hypothetical protein
LQKNQEVGKPFRLENSTKNSEHFVGRWAVINSLAACHAQNCPKWAIFFHFGRQHLLYTVVQSTRRLQERDKQ